MENFSVAIPAVRGSIVEPLCTITHLPLLCWVIASIQKVGSHHPSIGACDCVIMLFDVCCKWQLHVGIVRIV